MRDQKWLVAASGAAIALAWATAVWVGDSGTWAQRLGQVRVVVGRGLLVYFTVVLIFGTVPRAYRWVASRPSRRLLLAGLAWRVPLAILIAFVFRRTSIEFLQDSDLLGAGLISSILATAWAVVIAAGLVLPYPPVQPNPWTQPVERRVLVWMLVAFAGVVVFVLTADEWVVSSFVNSLFDRGDLLVLACAVKLGADARKKYRAFLGSPRVTPDSSPSGA